jgi:hypothetical protein
MSPFSFEAWQDVFVVCLITLVLAVVLLVPGYLMGRDYPETHVCPPERIHCASHRNYG